MSPLQEYSIGGLVDSGRLVVANRAELLRAIGLMPDGPVVVTVKRSRPTRSLQQNAFWWAVPVRILAEHCGYTDTQMHYALLGECFGYQPGPTSQPVPVKPSSSELTVDEFTHLIEWVLTWAPTELGVTIPGPNEWQAQT